VVRLTLHASHDGLESPNLDGEVRDREVSRETLEALRQDFWERFGREPGPDDPVFFDPSAEKPQLLDEDGEALFIPMSEMAHAARRDRSIGPASGCLKGTQTIDRRRNQGICKSGRVRRKRGELFDFLE
jgi:hypothetical protein